MLTAEQTLELVLYCKVGVCCLAWLTFVVTARWFREERRAKPTALGAVEE